MYWNCAAQIESVTKWPIIQNNATQCLVISTRNKPLTYTRFDAEDKS